MNQPALNCYPFALTDAERDIIKAQPKVLLMPPHLQEAKDRKLCADLALKFGGTAIADRIMAVIKEHR